MADTPNSDYEAQLRAANEAVYKQSAELALKNKTLELLGKLYEISVLSLARKEQAERVTRTIQQEFDFPVVALYAYNNVTDILEPLAVAISKNNQEGAQESENLLNSTYIKNATHNPFFNTIIDDRTFGYTEILKDVWGDERCDKVCAKLAATDFVRSTLGYPLIVDNRTIGVILLSLNRKYDELIEYESTAIKSFINVIAITLDKVMLYEQLDVANHQQESLIHFISHEVKGALGKCSGILSLIVEGDYGSVSPKMTDAVEHGLQHTREAAEMVTTILLSANIKSGAIKFEKKDFSLKSAIENILNSFQKDIQQKHLQISFEADSDKKYLVNGDENMLTKHVVGNLIDNAIRYTPEGSITIRLEEKESVVVLSVKDSGIGLTADDRERLFTAGGRGKDSVKVNVNSTGYGLYFARQLVEKHEGTIIAESEGRGKGSTFTVTLPRATM